MKERTMDDAHLMMAIYAEYVKGLKEIRKEGTFKNILYTVACETAYSYQWYSPILPLVCE
jgi:hypothetical protein